MTTIVSIRGTHGSGKSTIVKKILDSYKHHEIQEQATTPSGKAKLRTLGYLVYMPTGRNMLVVGPYKTACGGCDSIQPYSDIWEIVETYGTSLDRDVLLEGALVSSSYGSIGQNMNAWGANAVFAFLDTPLERCLDRIFARRVAKWEAEGKAGLPEAVNPHNTAVKFENVLRTKQQMAKLGSSVRIVDIDHTKPTQQVLKLFGINIRKELP